MVPVPGEWSRRTEHCTATANGAQLGLAHHENESMKTSGTEPRMETETMYSPTIVPAYGRDFRSKKAAQESLDSGQDWIDYLSTRACNVDDLRAMGLTQVKARSADLRKVWILTITRKPTDNG